MAEEDDTTAASSSAAAPEQKVLAGQELSPVSPVDAGDAPLQSRERSLSTSTRRSGHYDSQRLERRPVSISSRSKGKGRRVNVDFREPVTSDDERYQPVSPLESENGRPDHSREDSHPNFSRPASIRRSSSRNVVAGPSSNNGNGNGNSNGTGGQGMSSLPTHLEAEDANSKTAQDDKPTPSEGLTALPTSAPPQDKPNRSSAQSIGSRRLRPPIHQSDLENGNTSSKESAPLPPFQQRISTEESGRRYKELPPAPSPWLRELYTISYLIFFSFLGTLARTGIEWLTFYPGAIIITPIIWANFAGSLLMGFLTEDINLFQDEWAEPLATSSRSEKRMSKQSRLSNRTSRLSGRTTMSMDFEYFQKKERTKIKKMVPLYIGLTTGFCGCFTSFALFTRDMFLALSNDSPSPINHPALPPDGATAISVSQTLPRNGGYSFMAVVAVIIATLALSIGGFVAGEQMALLCQPITPRLPSKFTRLFLDRLVVILAFGCWLGAIFLLIWPPDRPGGPLGVSDWAYETWRGIELFSMVFSPLGCLLRYYVSKKVNSLEPSFPLGTFACNMLGTAVLAICYDLQHISLGDAGIGGGLLGCQALEGIIDGFTGCLTTVSTWVAEISALKRRYSWIYAFTSIVGGLALVVVVMGPVRWTIGWNSPVCVTSYVDKY